MCLSLHCLHNEQHNRGAVIYAWIIWLLLLEQCFKITCKANPLPHAHGRTWARSLPVVLFPHINFTSFLLMSLSCPLYARNSSHASGALLAFWDAPPGMSQHRAFETGSGELFHLVRAKLFTLPWAI